MDRKFADVDYDSPLWTFFISPASVLSFVLTFLCTYLFSPLLFATFLPGSKKIKPEKKAFFNSLLPSTVHSVVTFSLTVYMVYYGLLGPTRAYSTSALGYITLHIALGYTVADLFVCLLDPFLRSVTLNFAHHIGVISVIASTLYLRGELMYFVVVHLITEGSTPFVNWRFTLYELGKKDSSWYSLSAVAMVISFLVFRIAKTPWYWYALIGTIISPESAKVSVTAKGWSILCITAFDILNTYWFAKMVKGLIKLAKKHAAVE